MQSCVFQHSYVLFFLAGISPMFVFNIEIVISVLLSVRFVCVCQINFMHIMIVCTYTSFPLILYTECREVYTQYEHWVCVSMYFCVCTKIILKLNSNIFTNKIILGQCHWRQTGAAGVIQCNFYFHSKPFKYVLVGTVADLEKYSRPFSPWPCQSKFSPIWGNPGQMEREICPA